MAFSVLDALNKNSKAGIDESPKARFTTKDISIHKIYPNKLNFYPQNEIEEKAGEILAVGLIEPLAVSYNPCEKGEYKIISGERRWRGLNLLVEQGYKEFEIVTCQIRTPDSEQEEKIEIIMANSHRQKDVTTMLQEEKELKETLEYMKSNNMTIKGFDLQQGRLRDIIAKILNTSKTKVAQIENINNNLIPEFQEELKGERLTFSAAAEIAGLPEEKQQEALTQYQESGNLTYTEVKELKKESQEPEEQPKEQEEINQEPDSEEPEETEETDQGIPTYEADPARVSSPCYTCTLQPYCNQKGSDVYHCEDYVNKSNPEPKQDNTPKEPEKRTPIDQNNHSKPKEQQEVKRIHDIKCAAMYFEDKLSGIKLFELRKNDRDYKVGDTLHEMEYQDGEYTGRDLYEEVIYMLEDYAGLTEGYCILGTKLT